jgi:hypothetical protein
MACTVFAECYWLANSTRSVLSVYLGSVYGGPLGTFHFRLMQKLPKLQCRSASTLRLISSIAFFLGFTAAHIGVWKSLVLMPVQDEIAASYATCRICATAVLSMLHWSCVYHYESNGHFVSLLPHMNDLQV